MAAHSLHLISHTHWDREWYLTYQQFRLKLVQMMDHLLGIFETDPGFRAFMLDGQTIALEDYLAIRPEREGQIRGLIAAGKLLIGPWYILSDEFLVSPEAIVRNLQEGRRLCQQFGGRMLIGYSPDPFGHIGQMPQILRGFGIDTACLWRGLADEPVELEWSAPDGSRVLTAYLRESYSNAANLPMDDPAEFCAEAYRLGELLAAHSGSEHVLLMHGTDHADPSQSTTACIDYAQGGFQGDRIIHSTLPEYFAALRAELQTSNRSLPVIQGELRACRRSPLLPGVLSSRIWIKQRNAACQNLLERWAEPASAWAAALSTTDPTGSPAPYLGERQAILRQAWRLLLQCHPHDSICGCSIDQVHEEMRPRFDQVEQIGEELTRQCLEMIAGQLDTRLTRADSLILAAIQVFNPVEGPRSDCVAAEIDLPEGMHRFEVIDDIGRSLPVQTSGLAGRDLFSAELDRAGFQSSLGMVKDGSVAGMVVRAFHFKRDNERIAVDVTLAESGQVDLAAWNQGMAQIRAWLEDPSISHYRVTAHSPAFTRFQFLADNVPGFGYRTFWVRGLLTPYQPARPMRLNPLEKALLPLAGRLAQRPEVMNAIQRLANLKRPPRANRIENEFLAVEVDTWSGLLTVTDKRSGQVFSGLNRLVDGGDRGDEYNYCPPQADREVVARVRQIEVKTTELEACLEIDFVLLAPQSLTPDRLRRSDRKSILPIHSQVRLVKGVPRVEIHTDIDNLARDHRLRVHFPTPFHTRTAAFDGHFEIITRALELPAQDASWVEQPRPEVPQRGFTIVSAGPQGLLLAARGLPEVEVAPLAGGAELRLTLLRCVGWLSRDDLSTRQGHAGPALETPGAQLIGRQHFEYALIPFNGTPDGAIQQAHAFDLPMRALVRPPHPGTQPACAAFIESDAGFSITAIKQSEEDQGVIVRGVQSGSGGTTGFRLNLAHAGCEQVRLDESVVRRLEPDVDGFYRIISRPWEIITLKFRL